jgi:protein gp37
LFFPHWVIVGGESGPKARPMQQEWVLYIKRQCDEQRSTFFFKQWGGWGGYGKKRAKKLNGRLLHGMTWDVVSVPATNPQIQSLRCSFYQIVYQPAFTSM